MVFQAGASFISFCQCSWWIVFGSLLFPVGFGPISSPQKLRTSIWCRCLFPRAPRFVMPFVPLALSFISRLRSTRSAPSSGSSSWVTIACDETSLCDKAVETVLALALQHPCNFRTTFVLTCLFEDDTSFDAVRALAVFHVWVKINCPRVESLVTASRKDSFGQAVAASSLSAIPIRRVLHQCRHRYGRGCCLHPCGEHCAVALQFHKQTNQNQAKWASLTKQLAHQCTQHLQTQTLAYHDVNIRICGQTMQALLWRLKTSVTKLSTWKRRIDMTDECNLRLGHFSSRVQGFLHSVIVWIR